MRRAFLLEIAAIAAILAAAAALRLGSPDRFIASDELRWTCRSVNFMGALDARDVAGTFQVGHPGVLTMWLGGLALPRDEIGHWWDLCLETDGGSDLSTLDDVGREGEIQTVAPLLFAARRGVAVGTTLLLAALYVVLRLAARVPAGPALAGVGLLAFDPFLLAHSRLLHVDALVSLTTLLAVVALGATAGRTSALAAWAAGVPAGIAVVAKSSALVLGPFAALFFAAGIWFARPRGQAARLAVRRFAAWCAGAAMAAAAVWPALARSPIDTVRRTLSKAALEGANPHEGGNFFLGKPVDDPGPLFYPVAAWFRVTPVGFVAIAIAVAAVIIWLFKWRARRDERPAPGVAITALLLAWAAVFALALTVGPKKFDRYLLPSLAAANLAGGMAMAAVAGASRGGRGLAAGAVVGVVALQLAIAERSQPYSLAYYNPLAGGPETAARTLLVGWGEGYELAADYLNGLPGAEALEVSVPGVANFAPLFKGRTRSAPGYRAGRTDYVVLYVSKLQRERNDDLTVALVNQPPVWEGEMAGLTYVRVYENPTLAPLRAALAERVGEGDLVVVDAESTFAKRSGDDAGVLGVWGHWGESEIAEAAGTKAGSWNRVWVVRYPAHDPDAALQYFAGTMTRGATESFAGGALEITVFERESEARASDAGLRSAPP